VSSVHVLLAGFVSGKLGSRCEFRQAFDGCSFGRIGGWYRDRASLQSHAFFLLG